MPDCVGCGAALTPDEIGATKKLINRGSTEFFCLDCLAKKFGVSVGFLKEKIGFWRLSGCLLFPQDENG